jgi:hypothetical protein
LSVEAPTLEDARDALAKTVEALGPGEIGRLVEVAGLEATSIHAQLLEVRDLELLPGHVSSAWGPPYRVPFPSPYVEADGTPHMVTSVVAFVDELGTSIASRSMDDASLSARRELLRRVRDDAVDESIAKFESLKWFSDNAVFGRPVDEALRGTDLGLLVTSVARYQLLLALGGRITRGGIAMGGFFADDDLVDGPALVDAHAIESKVADVPRVLLGESALEVLAEDLRSYGTRPSHWARSPWAVQIAIDRHDDEAFVNYLSAALEADSVPEQVDVLAQHARVVEERRASAPDGRALNKIEWLAGDITPGFARTGSHNRKPCCSTQSSMTDQRSSRSHLVSPISVGGIGFLMLAHCAGDSGRPRN